MLKIEVGQLKESNAGMQQKFNTLAQSVKTDIEMSTENIILQVVAQTEDRIVANNTTLKEYVHEVTNPVRMNLPTIGVFAIVTTIFLLLIARTYNFRGDR